MRLSEYPYVVVRVGCSKCSRRGSYRLARLADRYGAEAGMHAVVTMLSADCKLAERGRPGIDRCGAFFSDLGGARPPDEPGPAARPRLRVDGYIGRPFFISAGPARTDCVAVAASAVGTWVEGTK